MPGARLFMPLTPLVLYLAALGVTHSLARKNIKHGLARRTRNLRIAGVLLFAFALTPQAILGVDAMVESGNVARSRALGGEALRQHLRTHAHSVALIDIGFLSYESDFDVTDLAGVTDPSIGRREGAHCSKPVTIDELLARGVDTLVVHSSVEPRIDDQGRVRHIAAHPTEMRLLSQPSAMEHFAVTEVVQYAPHYWYVVLQARGHGE